MTPRRFSSRLGWLGVHLLAPLSGAMLAACLLVDPTIDLMPLRGIPVDPYSDSSSTEGGASPQPRPEWTDQGLAATFELRRGAEYPYNGFYWRVASPDRPLDFTGHTHLRIRFASTSQRDFKIMLRGHIEGFSQEGDYRTERSYLREFDLPLGSTRFEIQLPEFQTPTWWYRLSGLSQAEAGPDELSRITGIALETGTSTALDEPREFVLEGIDVVDSPANWVPLVILWAFVAWLITALLVLLFELRRRQKLLRAIPQAILAGDSLEVITHGGAPSPVASGVIPRLEVAPPPFENYADREVKSLVDFITTHYTDPNLDLQAVSRGTGVPESRLGATLRHARGLPFKPFLNQVRLEAAKKLLTDSDLPVVEVADKVGYRNVSHFNRVFRQVEGCTPSAFRARAQGKDAPPEESEADIGDHDPD